MNIKSPEWFGKIKHKKAIGYAILILVLGMTYFYHQQQQQSRVDAMSLSALSTLISTDRSHEHRLASALYLIEKKPDTYYADTGKLFLAKHHYDENDITTSISILSELAEQASSIATQDLARIRLANIYFTENNDDMANDLIDQLHYDSFKTLGGYLRAMNHQGNKIPDDIELFKYLESTEPTL